MTNKGERERAEISEEQSMAQHQNVQPMTADQRIRYAIVLREIAKHEPDEGRRDTLIWIAENYEKEPQP